MRDALGATSGFDSRRPDDSDEVGLRDNVDQIPSEHITVKLVPGIIGPRNVL